MMDDLPFQGLRVLLVFLVQPCDQHVGKGCAEAKADCQRQDELGGKVQQIGHVSFSLLGLAEEVVRLIGCKVIGCTHAPTKRLAVTDLLQVVQPTGDALVAIGVECVEVD